MASRSQSGAARDGTKFSLVSLGYHRGMPCSWMHAPDGQWVVLIPEGEVHLTARGKGTYVVERRDGSESEVLVDHVSETVRTFRGVRYRCGIPERASRERSSKIDSLSHAPTGPYGAKLSRDGQAVVAPVSVIDRHVDRREPVVVDGQRLWIDRSARVRTWDHKGVRMARVPVLASKVV